MTLASHVVAWPQTAQRTGEVADTDERQQSRERHRHVHHPQTARASIVLTCGEAESRSIFSENAGVSHLTADFAPEQVGAGVAMYNNLVPAGITARTHHELTALFGGLALVPPGVVPLTEWRPDHSPVRGVSADAYAGLAVTGQDGPAPAAPQPSGGRA